MQDEKENINNQDFEHKIRQKLENQTFQVDESVWKNIESQLKQKNRKVIPLWYWLTGGAAVAILVLLFTISIFNREQNYYSKLLETKQIYSQKKQRISNKSISESQRNSPIAKAEPKGVVAKVESLKTGFHSVLSQPVMAQTGSVERLNGIPDSPKQSEANEKQVVSADVNQSDSTSELKKQETYPVWENKVTTSQNGKAKSIKTGILLAAAFSAGGSFPTSSTGYNMTVGVPNIVTAATNFTGSMTPKDFSQITYFTPVSVGFLIQKPIDTKWKLESGLVYSYLSSNFKNSGVQQSEADLHLHYIGLPLNLIATILNNSKWEFYVSGGGMLEKGIRSIYIQNQYFGNQTITTTASTNIAGLQWSVNGAIGTTFKIQKNIGIYFEPKISYFFNNNQPISGRTDQPVSIGLTAGLRFLIK